MSDTEMNYMAKFSLDTSDLLKGITGAAISFDAITLAAKEAFAMIKSGYEMTVEKAIAYGESIHTLADITGESEENIQRLRGAAMAVGTDFESVSTTMRMFSQRLADTGSAGEALRSRLADIGVSVRDANGSYRDASTLFMEINTKLGEMPNVYARNNLAMDVYGRNWSSIVDMISNATRASAAFEKVDPISEADIIRAKEFGIQLSIVETKMDKIGVNVGMNMIQTINDMGKAFDEAGYRASHLTLGAFLGGEIGDEKSSGADRDPNQKLKEAMVAIAPLVDTYGGLSDAELKYSSAAADVQTAQENLNKEMGSGTQNSVDKASLALANAKSAYQAIRKEMFDTAQAASGMNDAIAKSVVPGATTEKFDKNGKENFYIGNGLYSSNPFATGVDGGSIGSFGGKANSDFASGLSSTNDIWAYAAANTDSASQSSDFLNQIRGVAASAKSIVMPGGANWTNTSENQNIMNQTQSLWSQYQQQKAGSQGFTQINYIQGDNAQQAANAIAEATSRAIARQVSE